MCESCASLQAVDVEDGSKYPTDWPLSQNDGRMVHYFGLDFRIGVVQLHLQAGSAQGHFTRYGQMHNMRAHARANFEEEVQVGRC